MFEGYGDPGTASLIVIAAGLENVCGTQPTTAVGVAVAVLVEVGVDYLQGFLLGIPVPFRARNGAHA